MKRSKLYVILFVAMTIAFAVIGMLVTKLSIDNIKNSTNRSIEGIIGVVAEKYPDIDETEIFQILSGEYDADSGERLLRMYGISEEDWLVYENEQSSYNAVFVTAAVIIAAGAAFTCVFIIYLGKRKKETVRLTNYLSAINSGKYDLETEKNTEDENSILRNEIYKTTVMLREYSEKNLNDKVYLKKSISDISHQIKTPMTSTMIMVDNLIEDDDMTDRMRKEFLHDIRQSLNDISFLVQSLLTLSRLDSNAIEFHFENESIDGIFDECIRNTDIIADLKGVNVLKDECKNIELKCDKKWISEALSNIIKNCIEHTGSGGRVTLSAEENRLYTQITVSDTGCGISEKDLPHIFERFYKSANSDGKGVGIGLSLAQSIIEKHNGGIDVKSSVGKGTTFTIKLYKYE